MRVSNAGRGPPRPEEVRVDPEDGQPRTFQELREACRTRYSEPEIQEYWNVHMLQHTGGPVHNVVSDPFMTHATGRSAIVADPMEPTSAPPPRSQGGMDQPRLPVPSRPNPAAGGFFASLGASDAGDVRQDPFLVNGLAQGGQRAQSAADRPDYDAGHGYAKRQQLKQAAFLAKRHWTESLYRLIGPGDPNRDSKSRNVLIVAPWLLFAWVLMLQLLLRHFSGVACVGLLGLLAAGSVCIIFAWHFGRRKGPLSLLSLGILLLVATVAGGYVGRLGWDRHWRQYWWMRTGFREGLTSASTPGMARADYAVIDFWDREQGATMNHTSVDHARATGYKDTDTYCVAPILSPDTAGASLVRVNFWAVGINCCQRSGGFTCDDSSDVDAGAGVVMLNGGMPCPDCNVDKFRAAVLKAEAVHNLVSARGAQFVRWVKSPSAVERSIFWGCFAFIVIAVAVAGLVFALLGTMAWYYGIGIQATSAESDSLNDTLPRNLNDAHTLKSYGATTLPHGAPPVPSDDLDDTNDTIFDHALRKRLPAM